MTSVQQDKKGLKIPVARPKRCLLPIVRPKRRHSLPLAVTQAAETHISLPQAKDTPKTRLGDVMFKFLSEYFPDARLPRSLVSWMYLFMPTHKAMMLSEAQVAAIRTTIKHATPQTYQVVLKAFVHVVYGDAVKRHTCRGCGTVFECGKGANPNFMGDPDQIYPNCCRSFLDLGQIISNTDPPQYEPYEYSCGFRCFLHFKHQSGGGLCARHRSVVANASDTAAPAGAADQTSAGAAHK